MTAIVRKILIRGVNWIGDAVLTTPAIKAVRRVFPDAHISLLVKPLVAEIFKGNPHINEIILYDDRFNSIMGRFKLARMLKARGFSTAILLQNAFDAAFITWLAGIPERIGYRRDWRRLLLTRSVPVEQEVLDQHQVHYYLNLLAKSLNISAEDTEPRIYLSQAETNDAKALLSKELGLTSGRPVIGINPGAAYGSAKRWMPERFAELAKKIVDELDGRVVLF
ncbi:MAG TPA: glycosyltransferase family 9 protein, partial [Nitrospirae bacterium]|nr:glycosyltransferase family 9 protein [Nitrospirota bacterium]